jgi:thymidylate synthase (FAD)
VYKCNILEKTDLLTLINEYKVPLNGTIHQIYDNIIVQKAQLKLTKEELLNKQKQIKKISAENQIPITLCHELTQFTVGKTEQTLNQCEETYQTMLRLGVAKETARRILPLCTKTTLYMNGTLRSWIHYLELRTDKATQLEHRVIAEEIKQIFQEEFPVIANVIFN